MDWICAGGCISILIGFIYEENGIGIRHVGTFSFKAMPNTPNWWGQYLLDTRYFIHSDTQWWPRAGIQNAAIKTLNSLKWMQCASQRTILLLSTLPKVLKWVLHDISPKTAATIHNCPLTSNRNGRYAERNRLHIACQFNWQSTALFAWPYIDTSSECFVLLNLYYFFSSIKLMMVRVFIAAIVYFMKMVHFVEFYLNDQLYCFNLW